VSPRPTLLPPAHAVAPVAPARWVAPRETALAACEVHALWTAIRPAHSAETVKPPRRCA
jgi:hypothetical protein